MVLQTAASILFHRSRLPNNTVPVLCKHFIQKRYKIFYFTHWFSIPPLLLIIEIKPIAVIDSGENHS
jgi:hypothetical protein